MGWEKFWLILILGTVMNAELVFDISKSVIDDKKARYIIGACLECIVIIIASILAFV